MNQAELFDAIVGSLLAEPAVADDADWDYLTAIATVGDDTAEVSAYTYTDGPGKPVKLTNPPFDALQELQAATESPTGNRWHASVIKVDRDRRKVTARFLDADEAGQFDRTPDNYRDVIESLRPQPTDFADTPSTTAEDPA